jgi:hypothetical protein
MAESAGVPLFDSMVDQGILKDNIFSFYMGMNEEEESESLFGALNMDKVVGELTYHPVVDQLFWSLELTDILYNGESLGICGG